MGEWTASTRTIRLGSIADTIARGIPANTIARQDIGTIVATVVGTIIAATITTTTTAPQITGATDLHGRIPDISLDGDQTKASFRCGRFLGGGTNGTQTRFHPRKGIVPVDAQDLSVMNAAGTVDWLTIEGSKIRRWWR